jgi:hypothetical protein
MRTVLCLVGAMLIGTFASGAEDVESLKAENERLVADLEKALARIRRLEAQIERLRSDKETGDEAADADPFAVGARFEGSRFYKQKGADPKKAQLWSLSIKTRDNARFTGVLRWKSIDGRTQTPTVTGKAPPSGKGDVTFGFSTGVFKQKFVGRMEDGQHIELRFSGTGVIGDRVFGTGNLELR